jgi:hypothetical protein
MPSDSSLVPFAWVRTRDGRLVPFEADTICQDLFAATERLGRPDAFLARELTDGILHFLAAEAAGTPPTTAQIAELVVKVVRELGQPALARALEENGEPKAPSRREEPAPDPWVGEVPAPAELAWRVAGAALRDYSLRRVFSRDLVAAQADGLLTLTGLEAPLEMAGVTLPPGPGLFETLEETRGVAGDFVALDGPEHQLAATGGEVAAYARELRLGLRATGLRAVVNLNVATPPSWADDLAEGPLFAAYQRPPDLEPVQALAESLREALGHDPRVRLDWHLAEGDFVPDALPRLVRVARAVLNGAAVAFVFDRPRRPVALAEGIDRRHPAVLVTAGVHVAALAARHPAALLDKLGSLARLALSAGRQKREFLRRHSAGRPALTRGFLLDRARLLVTPVGLDSTAGVDLARRIVERLHAALQQDGSTYRLEAVPGYRPAPFDGRPDPELPPEPLGPFVALKRQVRAVALWHTTTELGTVALALPEEPPAAEELVELLRQLWRQTDVVRVRFLRPATPAPRMVADWAESPVPATP